MTTSLPVTIDVQPGQALDCYLEHLADANGLSPAQMTTAVRRSQAASGGAATAFLTLKPVAVTAARISRLAGQSPQRVRAATLAAFARGRPLDLAGFDATQPITYRAVSARGWIPGYGSQICPPCLAETGIWQITWRLPTSTVCPAHRSYLMAMCPGCQRPFRAQRHSPLRPNGAGPECGNPIGQGPRRQCTTDLTALVPESADQACVDRQARHDGALNGVRVLVLGEPVTVESYLADSRYLTTLLLHLAGRPGADALAGWVGALHVEDGHRGAGVRGARWGLRPPDNPALRSRALTVADSILTATSLDEAVTALEPWLDLTPQTPDGVLGWLADRTVMTVTLSRLVMAARAPHRRLSHHLGAFTGDQMCVVTGIPQVICAVLYDRHLATALDSGPSTGRLFAALALARTVPGVTTWAAAADGLGVSEAVGVKTARACSAAMTVSPQRFASRLLALANDLSGIDYRDLEQRVRGLADRSRWFQAWARTRPGTRATSHPYAVTWLWLHVARGHLSTTPGWATSPDMRERARYRAFEASLTDAHQEGLRAVMETASRRHERSTAGVFALPTPPCDAPEELR